MAKHQLVRQYYKIRQPGDSFTPEEQWMHTIVKELWEFSITIWKERNSELHGTTGAISIERLRKDSVMKRGWCAGSVPPGNPC
jgi:hypothetical protein